MKTIKYESLLKTYLNNKILLFLILITIKLQGRIYSLQKKKTINKLVTEVVCKLIFKKSD